LGNYKRACTSPDADSHLIAGTAAAARRPGASPHGLASGGSVRASASSIAATCSPPSTTPGPCRAIRGSTPPRTTRWGRPSACRWNVENLFDETYYLHADNNNISPGRGVGSRRADHFVL